MNDRKSGVLMHVTSLPGRFGIGDLGPEAFRFVDFLASAEQSVWQILPLTVTSSLTGNSPYSSLSAFALNPLLVSPEILLREGLTTQEHVEYIYAQESGPAHFRRVKMLKEALLMQAFENFQKTNAFTAEFEAFQQESSGWLEDYVRFVVLKQVFGGEIWCSWPEPFRYRDEKEMQRFAKLYEHDLMYHRFVQFIVWKQWQSVRDYCHQKGVQVMGDLPIYVETDSADVWSSPECFKLDKKFRPEWVAGVPPDYFSETGQLWGNPVYRWDVLKQQNFRWWIDRFKHNIKLYDEIRIDHFRGLVQYWEVPAGEKTAINGHWADVPVQDFLKTVFSEIDSKRFVAEDLGTITDDVYEVMDQYGLGGMKVLMFGFGDDLEKHPYLPHNYAENSVAYTGTHDNNTAVGWFKNEMTAHEAGNLNQYVGHEVTADSVAWDLIKLIWESPSHVAIAPVQDLLSYDETARMNIPGVGSECWRWRCPYLAFSDELSDRLRELTVAAGRGKTKNAS
ncbi:4-alpha-glucanotransferase [Rhodopirellula sp. MGV]|uniref:4-alpha-glucanotransferase n=1 Tax=Rhodopirellula sp. MGV TaxID=2023130 RepID=UPI000B973132|nr:4-alpha-glucanotransferase [Rhodopirellula sp. MGV]OYP33933.1 4-alpha-glucanotransferase [Rhodopirellula sp. MGV]PNY34085.1 4-alpha-glucanotransferase [Rhodopirellula baltica]